MAKKSPKKKAPAKRSKRSTKKVSTAKKSTRKKAAGPKKKPAKKKAPVPKAPTAKTISKAAIIELLAQAAAGKLPAIHKEIIKAGYVDPVKPGDKFLSSMRFKVKSSLEKFFGQSRQTLYRWTKKGMPIEPDGTYSPARIAQWRLADGAADEGVGQQLDSAKIKKYNASSDLEQMKVLEMKGILVDRASVIRLWRQYISALSAQINSWLPGVLAEMPEDQRARVARILNEFVTLLLKDLADTKATPDEKQTQLYETD